MLHNTTVGTFNKIVKTSSFSFVRFSLKQTVSGVWSGVPVQIIFE